MKIQIAGLALLLTICTWIPAHAAQEAIIPAYAYVSAFKSSMAEYKNLIEKQNRSAARKMVNSRKIFISPKDIKVEVVSSTDSIAKVRINQLDKNAQPITLYFYTLVDQLKFVH
jgi:predicted nucleotide-binding protein